MTTTQNPFPGPRPYERENASDFVGRDREIAELRSLIASRGVVVVVGPSGCGKSSLLRAGVLPELERGEYELLPIARLGEAARGQGGMASAGNVFERNVASYLVDGALPAVPHPLLAVLDSRPRIASSDGAPMSRVLIIDQFEELFTTNLTAWRERIDLLQTVLSANDGAIDTRMVLALRAEYLSAFAALLNRLVDRTSARERSVAYFHVERLSQQVAGEVIETVFTRRFQDFPRESAVALARQLSREKVLQPDGTLAESEGEYVDPLYLQLVCRARWEKLAAGESVTAKTPALEADIKAEVRDFVRVQIEAAAVESKTDAGEIRRWLEKHFITEQETRGSVIRDTQQTAGMPNAVPEALERRHLLRAEERAAGYWFELAHDRLVQGVLDLAAQARAERTRRVERVVRGAFALLFLAAIGNTVWQQTRSGGDVGAAAAPPQALAVRTAENARGYLESDPELAADWIQEALGLAENDPIVDSIAREVATRSLQSRAVQKLTTMPNSAVALDSSALVAVGTDDGRVMVLNVLHRVAGATGAAGDSALSAAANFQADMRGVVPGWARGVVGMAYAADDSTLAVAGRGGRVSLLSRPDWNRDRDTTLNMALSALTVTPSAREIAVGVASGGAVVRLPAVGRVVRARAPGVGRITSLAYVNGRDLLVLDERGTLLLWRAGETALSRLWTAPAAAGSALAHMVVAPGGGDVVVATADSVFLLQYSDGVARQMGTILCQAGSGAAGTVTSIAVSRDGGNVLLGMASGRVAVWEIRSGTCAVQPPATSSAINALTTVGRQGWLVSAGANLEIRLWFGGTPSPEQVQQQVERWKEAARAK